MTTPNVGDITATTLRARRGETVDQITNHNALLRRMQKKGRLKVVVDGGRTILEEIMHGSNSSIQFYSGFDEFNPPGAGQDSVDGAEYNAKQLGGFAAYSGEERAKNSGKARTVNLVETRVEQLIANLRNTMSTSLYSDGTGSGSKEFGGLRLLVADDPTAAGTVGAINQVTNAFWQNQYSAAAATSSATITGRMNAMYLSQIRGSDVPDLWIGDAIMYRHYWESLQAIQRITTGEMAEAGFAALQFMQSDVVYDSACPSKHLYSLMTDYLAFRFYEGRWFDVDDARKVVNADYDVVPVWVMGNLTCRYRRGQGVIIAS